MLRVRRRNAAGELVELTESSYASVGEAMLQLKYTLKWLPKFAEFYRRFYDGVGAALDDLAMELGDLGASDLAREVRDMKDEALQGAPYATAISRQMKALQRGLTPLKSKISQLSKTD